MQSCAQGYLFGFIAQRLILLLKFFPAFSRGFYALLKTRKGRFMLTVVPLYTCFAIMAFSQGLQGNVVVGKG